MAGIDFASDASTPLSAHRVLLLATLVLAPACGDEAGQQLGAEGNDEPADLACSPSTLSFGVVLPRSGGEVREVRCRALGAAPVTLTPALGASTSPDFTLPDPSPRTISPGSDGVAIAVAYAPRTLGDDEGVLRLRGAEDERVRPQRVRLIGAGGGPDLEIVPAQIIFGLTSLLAPSRRQFVLTNVGGLPLELFDVRIEPSDAPFEVDAPGPSVLAPGESRVLEIEYHPPTEQGRWEARLVIETNDADHPVVQIPLRAESTQRIDCPFALQPDRLDFGVAWVGAPPSPRWFEIRNLSEARPCLVTRVSLRPESDPEFSLPDGELSSVLIPPGSALSVPVGYGPEAPGRHTGAVEFSISNPDSPFNIVPLSATATGT